jgi:hypothetical protein
MKTHPHPLVQLPIFHLLIYPVHNPQFSVWASLKKARPNKKLAPHRKSFNLSDSVNLISVNYAKFPSPPSFNTCLTLALGFWGKRNWDCIIFVYCLFLMLYFVFLSTVKANKNPSSTESKP